MSIECYNDVVVTDKDVADAKQLLRKTSRERRRRARSIFLQTADSLGVRPRHLAAALAREDEGALEAVHLVKEVEFPDWDMDWGELLRIILAIVSILLSFL